MTALSVRNLTLCFGGVTAVRDLSFSVVRGTITSIIGPNGAGKTSAFNAISGVYVPTSGTIEKSGQSIARQLSAQNLIALVVVGVVSGVCAPILLNCSALWQAVILNHLTYQAEFPWSAASGSFIKFWGEVSPLRSFVPGVVAAVMAMLGAGIVWHRGKHCPEAAAGAGLARTFQNIRLFRELTALQNVMIALEASKSRRLIGALFRLPAFRAQERAVLEEAQQYLQLVELDSAADKEAGTLPYGLQRRLEIARALATGAETVLLDEPAAGMNPSEAQSLMELLKKIRASGRTIVLIEHHMRVVMGVSDHVVVLHQGQKLAEGKPDDVRRNPAVIEAYLGEGSHAHG